VKNSDSSNRFLRLFITAIAVVTIFAHMKWPELKIDSITLTLMAIAGLPWFGPILKSIEIFGVKIEYQDLAKAGEEAKRAGLLKEKPITMMKQMISVEPDYSFLTVAREDTNLALTGLRIEIESRLRKLAKLNKIDTEDKKPRYLIQSLEEKNLLSQREMTALDNLLGVLNRASRGTGYDERIADWLKENGPKLLETLDEKISKNVKNR